MALVKEFAGLLGGTVTVQSELGKGSQFSVECVASQAPKTLKSESVREKHQSLVQRYEPEFETKKRLTPGFGRSQKVLVVEDNTEVSSYIASLLSESCEVQTTKDGDEALSLVHSWGPHLVLADIMMPKKDGITLCKEIKADPEFFKIPVILLTALTDRESLLKGWQAGADEYLFKPFHPQELVTRIQSVLSKAETHKNVEMELQKKIKELQLVNKVMMERENKILELKAELSQHYKKAG